MQCVVVEQSTPGRSGQDSCQGAKQRMPLADTVRSATQEWGRQQQQGRALVVTGGHSALVHHFTLDLGT